MRRLLQLAAFLALLSCAQTAHAAIAVVQCRGGAGTAPCSSGAECVSGAAALSNPCIYQNNPTTNNLLIAGCDSDLPPQTLTPSDSRGNTWNQIDVNDDSVGGRHVEAWYALANGTGSGTDTFTCTSNVSADFYVFVSEWSGVATVSPLDQHSIANNVITDPACTVAKTTTVPNELIWGVSETGALTSVGSGFTLLAANAAEPANGDNEYKIVSVTGSYQTCWANPNTAGVGGVMGTFKQAAAGGACTPTLTLLGVGRCN
jgi:hypothetical protein